MFSMILSRPWTCTGTTRKNILSGVPPVIKLLPDSSGGSCSDLSGMEADADCTGAVGGWRWTLCFHVHPSTVHLDLIPHCLERWPLCKQLSHSPLSLVTFRCSS